MITISINYRQPERQVIERNIILSKNNQLMDRLLLIKKTNQETLTVKRGFKTWLKYVKAESNKLYFDNLNR